MAVEKSSGRDVTLYWGWWLSAHAATHGLAVALLTGIPVLGLMEMFLHAIIDWAKIRFRLTLLQDQSLHLFFKLICVSFLLAV